MLANGAIENADALKIRFAEAKKLFPSDPAKQRQYLILLSHKVPDAQAQRLANLPVQTREEVKERLENLGKYTGENSADFSVHQHHFYPEWLGGKVDGPTIAVRGFEHNRRLHTEIHDFLKMTFDGQFKSVNKKALQAAFDAGIEQGEITEALFKFYKNYFKKYYPADSITDAEIRLLLNLGE